MNDSRRKYKGARTIKKRSFGTRIRKRNRSYARTLKGGGWGKSKSPEDKAATNQAKKEKEDAKKIAKDEQKKKEADKKAAEKEAKKEKEAEKKATKEKQEAEKQKKEAEKKATKVPENVDTTKEKQEVKKEYPEKTKEGTNEEKETEQKKAQKNETQILYLGTNLKETATDDNPEKPAETDKKQSEGAKKPWYKRAKNGIANSAIGKTLKKGTNTLGEWATKKGQNIKEGWEEFAEGAKEKPIKTMWNTVKSPFRLGAKAATYTGFKVGQKLTGFKKWAANTADTISPMRQIQRYKTWSRRSDKAKSDTKYNKYIDKVVERKNNIQNLENEQARIFANTSLSKEEQQTQLAKLEKKLKGEKSELEFDEFKASKWKGKQDRADAKMTALATELAYKSAPVKEELNEKLITKQAALIRNTEAQQNAEKEIDAELDAEFKEVEQAAQSALEQDNDYKSAQTLANSSECKTTDGKPENEKQKEQTQKCAQAKNLITQKNKSLEEIKEKKATAKEDKKKEIKKRILKKHSMDLMGNSLQKLTKTMRLPRAISTPGTPENTELQEKIRAHIDQQGTMPPAEEISKMVAGTAYEQTLTNTAKSMSLEVKNSLTSRQAAYKTGKDALANISHPMAKSGVIKQSIQEFIPQLEDKLNKLRTPLIQNPGESAADFTARKNAHESQLRMTLIVLQTVKQMTAAGKPPEEIYKFISRYNTDFGATVAKKTNDLEQRKAKLKVGTNENKNAVEDYYKAEMAALGYTDTNLLQNLRNPKLMAFARQYYKGPPHVRPKQNLTAEEIKTALENYKTNYLPSRIANNPDTLNKLQKPTST